MSATVTRPPTVTRAPTGVRPPGMTRGRALLRLVVDVRRGLRGHDMWLLAGGLTFYAGIAVVPLLLLALYLAGLLVGPETVRGLALDLVRFAPEGLGLAEGIEALADVGPSLGVTAALAALVPATTYGEGLVRAFDRLGGRERAEGRVWRGRLRSFALLALLPGLVMVGLLATAALPDLLGRGPVARVLGVWATFWVGWVSSSVLLCLTYRAFVPEPLGARALFWGSASAGSFLTGMSLAWVYLLGADLDFARAYGGSEAVAAVVLASIYLFLVQLVTLLGYVLTLRIAARGGHPLAG